jgi:hypothetical protein
MFRRNSPAIPSASPGHDRREGTGEATPQRKTRRCSRGEFGTGIQPICASAVLLGDGSSCSADARGRRSGTGLHDSLRRGVGPGGLGAVSDSLTSKLGWSSPLARSELLASWLEIAGAAGQPNIWLRPIIGREVKCSREMRLDWLQATQPRFMRVQDHGLYRVDTPPGRLSTVPVRFEARGRVPSWKRGPRSPAGVVRGAILWL